MTSACDFLAKIGFESLLAQAGGPTVPEWRDDDDQDTIRAAEYAARMNDHDRLGDLLLSSKPEPRSGDLNGAKWLRLITWPDRVPGLKTWAAQSTLPKIIAAHQRRLRESDERDLFAARGAFRTGKGEGPSGLDWGTCRDAIDVGFSPSLHGMEIECRPAVELLAIVGLECVPIVSFGPRECGVIHDGAVWRFPVEQRDGGYFFRWGLIREEQLNGDRPRPLASRKTAEQD